MKMLSTPSILLLTVALGAGAGIVASSLTLGYLRDYDAIISTPNSISLSSERVRPGPSSYNQALEQVRDKVSVAAVEIFSKPSDSTGAYEPGHGQASGFFITSDGWVLTAPYSYYLSKTEINQAKVLVNGKLYPVQEVVNDSDFSLSFLKINITNVSVVTFGNPLILEAGENLFVNSASDEVLTTSFFRFIQNGELSAPAETASRRLELNVAVDSRFAGSAVANSSGEVVGILVADQFSETKTVLPFTAIKPAVYSLLKEDKIISLWFGAIVTDLSRAIGYDEAYTKGYTKGALVGTITKDSPAETVGLQRGDIIISVGGLEISEKQSLDELLFDYHVGDTVNLIIDRDGTNREINVILGSR